MIMIGIGEVLLGPGDLEIEEMVLNPAKRKRETDLRVET
jgi:hypothetical protein